MVACHTKNIVTFMVITPNSAVYAITVLIGSRIMAKILSTSAMTDVEPSPSGSKDTVLNVRLGLFMEVGALKKGILIMNIQIVQATLKTRALVVLQLIRMVSIQSTTSNLCAVTNPTITRQIW